MWARELLTSARVARLGLLDDHDHPRVLPVTLAIAEGRIWSAVDDKPKRTTGKELARIRYLRRNPRAALTADRYFDDWTKLAWVQVLGNVQIVPAADAPAVLASLIAKYDTYRDSPPRGPLLALHAERYLFWRANSEHHI